jgi:hypothetical protein
MKLLYLAFFLAFTTVSSGQDFPGQDSRPKQESHDFTLYPNPAFDDVVYVTTERNEHKMITVYDVFGKVVLKDRIATNALNISRLVPGVYVLQVVENSRTMTRKLVVK